MFHGPWRAGRGEGGREEGERTTDQGPDFGSPYWAGSSELVLLCQSVKKGVINVIGERSKLGKALEHFISITVLLVVYRDVQLCNRLYARAGTFLVMKNHFLVKNLI